MSEKQKHPYHLVDPSPWPLVTAMSLLILAYGFVTFMHDEQILMFAIGNVALILSSFFGGEILSMNPKVDNSIIKLFKLV